MKIAKRKLGGIIILALCVLISSLSIAAGKEKIKLEVAAFEGGYGIGFYQEVGKQFEVLHPEIAVNVWGNPRIGEQLRPRFIAGNPPDVCFPIGPSPVDVWVLLEEDKLYSLDEALESSAIGQEAKWKDTFIPSLLESGKAKGHYYLLPGNMDVYSWWYDAKLFRDNGWRVPKTYQELLRLCEKIKGRGIAPITFQGKYPVYMTGGFLIPFAVRIGGLQALVDAENLLPGVWESEPFLKAAQLTREMLDKGYFQKGAMGMTHTESQVEFFNRKAAMIPCGTWLEAEMTGNIPEDFELRMMSIPVVKEGVDPTIVGAVVNYWVVPLESKHPELGAEYLKLLFSLDNAKKWVKEKKSLLPIIGSDTEGLSSALQSAVKIKNQATTIFIEPFLGWTPWYPSLGKVVDNGMAALLNKEITPEEYVEQIEAEAQRIREDSSIPKYHREY